MFIIRYYNSGLLSNYLMYVMAISVFIGVYMHTSIHEVCSVCQMSTFYPVSRAGQTVYRYRVR